MKKEMRVEAADIKAVSWLLQTRGYKTFQVARKAGRAVVGTKEMQEEDKQKLWTAIEDNLEYGASAEVLVRERHLPYSTQGFAHQRRKYCEAYLSSLRAIDNCKIRILQ